jgi:serine/threonine protein phosphatase PrpC
MSERPKSEPFSEDRPTIPVPKNPFEVVHQPLRLSSVSIPKNEKGPSGDSQAEFLDPDGSGATFVVADGMGGYAGDHVASGLVVKAVEELNGRFIKMQALRNQGKARPGMWGERDVLYAMLNSAIAKIAEGRAQDRRHDRMGSTAVVARVVRMKDGRWEGLIASIGDSRASLLWPDGRLETLTLDAHPLLIEVQEKIGRDAAMRVQDTLDNLESARQFHHFISILKEGSSWPEDAEVSKDDIVFLNHVVGATKIEEYFDGPKNGVGFSVYYRSVLHGSLPSHPLADIVHVLIPDGAKLVLTSDAIDVLTLKEQEALLSNNPDAAIDPMLRYEAAQGTDPADQLSRALEARADFRAYSPRSRGRDDISIKIIEIPKRIDADQE